MKSYLDLPPAIANSEVITLIPWVDKRFDAVGFDPRSAYVEQFWLATLGPATTWFLRHCAGLLDHTACTPLNLEEAATALGIKHEGGIGSAMVRTVARACRFRTARIVGESTLSVRRRLPQVSKRQLQRLPGAARRRHQEFLSINSDVNALALKQSRARQLALSLINSGDTISETERQLTAMRMHPAVVAEAVHWAWDSISSTDGQAGGQAGGGQAGGQAGLKVSASSISMRTPKPVPPLAISPSSDSALAGPAMSR